MNDKIAVLVTGIGGGGNGEQILKALRLAGDLNLHLIGTDMSALTAGHRLVDAFYEVPGARDPQYGERLFEILRKEEVRFIFHGSEPELAFISENRETIEALGVITCLNNRDLMRLCSNKVETYRTLEALGFIVPRYAKIESIQNLKAIDFFPVVLKPNTGSGGSSHVHIARDREELMLLGSYLLKLKLDLVAQAYVGHSSDEFTIGVDSNRDAEVLGSIVIKRAIGNAMSTRSRIPSLDGETSLVISSGFSQGWVCRESRLQEQAEALARQLGSTGPLNIQCRWVDGQLLLMEINPRLSGTTSLRAMAGYNEPVMHICHQLYGTPWHRNYQEKLILRALEEVEVKDIKKAEAVLCQI